MRPLYVRSKFFILIKATSVMITSDTLICHPLKTGLLRISCPGHFSSRAFSKQAYPLKVPGRPDFFSSHWKIFIMLLIIGGIFQTKIESNTSYILPLTIGNCLQIIYLATLNSFELRVTRKKEPKLNILESS